MLKYIYSFLICLIFLTNISLAQSGADEFENSRHIQTDTSKYSLKMSLAKTVYKEFEPVLAKFELINNDEKALEIYGTFDTDESPSEATIEDDSGNCWKQYHQCVNWDGSGPLYPIGIITKGDTLVTSIPINGWGKDSKPSPKLCRYFNICGYFPAGRKYKASFHAVIYPFIGRTYGIYINSNTVEFETINRNSEDSTIFDFYNHAYGKISEDSADAKIMDEFPENTFTEYITAECIRLGYAKGFKEDGPNNNNILDIYKKFFDKYANSNYIYDYHFLRILCEKLFRGRHDYANVIQFASEYFNNPNLNRLFSNSVFLGWISTFIKR